MFVGPRLWRVCVPDDFFEEEGPDLLGVDGTAVAAAGELGGPGDGLGGPRPVHALADPDGLGREVAELDEPVLQLRDAGAEGADREAGLLREHVAGGHRAGQAAAEGVLQVPLDPCEERAVDAAERPVAARPAPAAGAPPAAPGGAGPGNGIASKAACCSAPSFSNSASLRS